MTRSVEELRAVPTLEQQYFERGKEVLGRTAGGLLVCLLRRKRGDLALARAVVEIAATKQDPREYVSRVAGPKNPGRLSVDQVNGLREQARKQLEERERLSTPKTEEEKAAVAVAHARFKRAMAQCPEESKDELTRAREAKVLGQKADQLAGIMRRAMDDFDREFGG